MNYGAIGAIIGHEISHGFDDQGRKIDATGAVRDWWTKSGRRSLQGAGEGLRRAVRHLRAGARACTSTATLTMGENIADLAGVLVALDAYHTSLQAASRRR